MSNKAKLVVGAIVVVVGAAATWIYIGFNRPWWDERAELDRVFASSNINITSDSKRTGSQLCFDDCPALRVGLTSTPKTYAGFALALMKALNTHGYTLDEGDLGKADPGGGTGGITCGQYPGDATPPWQCKVSGNNGAYFLIVNFEFPGSVVPEQVFDLGGVPYCHSLPDDTALVKANALIQTLH